MPRSADRNLEGRTGVLLILHFAVPSIVLLGTPQVTFDGLFPMKMGWGREFVPLVAGEHNVSCHVHFFRALTTGKGECAFVVPENTVVGLRWVAPLFMTGRGWWKDLGPL
jgi:hypothetical protein